MDFKQQGLDTLKNIILVDNKLLYIVDSSNWSIKWDGKQITKELNSTYNLKSRITTSRFAIRNKIIHFGSLGTFIKYNGIVPVHHSNKVVFTWFHITENDTRIKFIKELNEKVNFVHTSCEITKKRLIKEGLKEDKIVKVPIGVDLKLFRNYPDEEKQKIKNQLRLPDNKLIIGSFQKDGVGWKDGNKPKLIKGPDIFYNTVEKLAKKHEIHILLTGPARGYVKKRLKKAGISFTHTFLKNYSDIVKYYNALDLYIVSSRAEGGPKAITESMACGVPIISTKVGMAEDVIENGQNGFLVEVEDVETMVANSFKILNNRALKNRIIANALETVKNYTWKRTSLELYEKIYKKLL